MAVRVPLTDTNKFLKLFDDEKYAEGIKKVAGILNPHHTNIFSEVFISSNTIFCRKIESFQEWSGITSPPSEENHYTWKKLFDATIKIESKIIKRAATVLAERVHLIKHSVFSHKNFEMIYTFTERFLEKLGDLNLEHDSDRKGVLEQIASINLFIDNIYSYSYRDFESPQKDIRIVTDAGKLLLLYTEFAQKIFDDADKSYKVLVVPNVNEIIENFSSDITETFIAKIPEDAIFDISTNLLLISHELGHSFDTKVNQFKAYKQIIMYILVYFYFQNSTNYEKRNPQDKTKSEFCDFLYSNLENQKLDISFDFDENNKGVSMKPFIDNCVEVINKYIAKENEKHRRRAEGKRAQIFAYKHTRENLMVMCFSAYDEAFADIFYGNATRC